VLNASRGTLLWSWNCTHIFSSAPSIADGRIYAGCNGTYAFGFSGKVALPPPVHAPSPATLGSPSDRHTVILPSGSDLQEPAFSAYAMRGVENLASEPTLNSRRDRRS